MHVISAHDGNFFYCAREGGKRLLVMENFLFCHERAKERERGGQKVVLHPHPLTSSCTHTGERVKGKGEREERKRRAKREGRKRRQRERKFHT